LRRYFPRQQDISRLLTHFFLTLGVYEKQHTTYVVTLILRPFQLEQKEQTNCGYKHNETTHVVKITFMNLMFRMLQQTSSEVTVT